MCTNLNILKQQNGNFFLLCNAGKEDEEDEDIKNNRLLKTMTMNKHTKLKVTSDNNRQRLGKQQGINRQ